MKLLCRHGFCRDASLRVVSTWRETTEPRHLPSRHRVVIIGSVGYGLKRDRSPLIRLMPEVYEREFNAIEEQIRVLRERLGNVRDEAWRRAEPYVFPAEFIKP